MDVENHLTVDRIAPVLGHLHLEIIQLQAAVAARDAVIAELRAMLDERVTSDPLEG